VSEYFSKSLNDVKISLENDVDADANVNVASDDKDVQRPEFLLKMAQETLKALAFLEYKGITCTNLVNWQTLLNLIFYNF